MKPIQTMFEERLLERLDADEEVQRDGRSAVIRRAVAEYLRRKRQRTIAEQYQAAYGDGDGEGLGDEFAGWDSEGVWPED